MGTKNTHHAKLMGMSFLLFSSSNPVFDSLSSDDKPVKDESGADTTLPNPTVSVLDTQGCRWIVLVTMVEPVLELFGLLLAFGSGLDGILVHRLQISLYF